jgi:hypothetical protein
MRKFMGILLVVLLLGSVALCVGCGKKRVAPEVVVIEPENPLAPDWYLNLPTDPNNFYSVAEAVSNSMQFAADRAKDLARVELANQFQVKITGLFKQFREEVGAPEDAELLQLAMAVSKSVVSESINGAKLVKQEMKEKSNGKTLYQAFVLMEMGIGEANTTLVSKVKANNRLYTQFRASKGFQELEKEVEEYEKWKKDQGGM